MEEDVTPSIDYLDLAIETMKRSSSFGVVASVTDSWQQVTTRLSITGVIVSTSQR